MANKKKSDKKKGSGRSIFPIRDLTAERHFESQILKARKLGSEEKYLEALQVLQPLREKFSDRAELFELLALSYMSLGYAEVARDFYEKDVELLAPRKPNAIVRYSLATLYLETGFPLLAHEQMQQVDPIEIQRLTNYQLGAKERNEFLEQSLSFLQEEAGKQGKDFDIFFKYEAPLEKGQLALERNEPLKARQYFEEAIQVDPETREAYSNLAATYVLEGDTENAIRRTEFLLEKFGADDLVTLSTLVRLLITSGQRERAEEYLNQIKALPIPTAPAELVKVAGAYAFFEQDQKVFDLIRPLMDAPEKLKELDETTYEDALMLGAVSATHLGQPNQARLWLRREEFEDEGLVARTWDALENEETGPREGGRFYYFDPELLFAVTLLRFGKLVQDAAAQNLLKEKTPELEKFIEEHGPQLAEVFVYQAWIAEEVDEIAELLGDVLEIKDPDGVELVKRLAFGQQANELLRLSAVATLMRNNIISREEPVTVWINGEQRTGEAEQVMEWLALTTTAFDEDEVDDLYRDEDEKDQEDEDDNSN
jgi:Flp pilus assembly protein TadD